MPKGPYSRYGSTLNPAPDQVQKIHIVIGGEELPSIAAVEYGQGYDQELWRQVAEANGITDLDDLQPGQALKIPQPTPSTT